MEREGAPGGFPGLVVSLQDIEARLQLQCIVLKAAKRGGHALDQQKSLLNGNQLLDTGHYNTASLVCTGDFHVI